MSDYRYQPVEPEPWMNDPAARRTALFGATPNIHDCAGDSFSPISNRPNPSQTAPNDLKTGVMPVTASEQGVEFSKRLKAGFPATSEGNGSDTPELSDGAAGESDARGGGFDCAEGANQ